MQLALTADMLVPLGAGTVAAFSALTAALTLGWRRRTCDVSEPTESDTGATAPPVPRWLTVADVVAVRVAEQALVTAPAPPPGRAADENTAGVRVEAPESGPADPAGGSSPAVAAAVAKALALRAAACRAPVIGPNIGSPGHLRYDVRDGLLAVLLDDPPRALGAAAELQACRGRLDWLSGAVRHERGVLSDILGRLAAAGLRPDQLARLSGLPVGEVRELLTRSAAAHTEVPLASSTRDAGQAG